MAENTLDNDEGDVSWEDALSEQSDAISAAKNMETPEVFVVK